MKKLLSFTFAPVLLSATLAMSAQQMSATADGYQFNFQVPDYRTVVVDTMGLPASRSYAGPQYATIASEELYPNGAVGRPDLPVYYIEMAIADAKSIPDVEVTGITASEQTLDLPIMPTQLPWAKSRNLADRPFSIDKAYYASAGTRSASPTVVVGEPYVQRGITCVRLEVSPFSYNPAAKTLTTYAKFNLKVKTAVTSFGSVDSKAFDEMFSGSLANYNVSFAPVRSAKMDNYLIICDPSYKEGLASFVEFRKSRFNVTLVTTTEAGGATNAAITAYIKKAYGTPATKPTYVLLVGSNAQIPSLKGKIMYQSSAATATDLYFSTLDGTDLVPDVLLGRFCVSSTAKLANIVKKTIHNETNLKATAKTALLMVGYDSKGNSPTAEGTMNYLNTNYFTPKAYKVTKVFASTGGTGSNCVTEMNKSPVWAIYSSHGNETSWAFGQGGSVTTTNAASMTNNFYFFSYGFCCLSGCFNITNCFAEAMTTSATGAATNWAASQFSYWHSDDAIGRAMGDAIFKSNITTVSASFNAGRKKSPSDAISYCWEEYNLFGDPALDVLGVEVSTKKPQVVTFDSLTSKTYGDADMTLTAKASSGLAVFYTSSDTTILSIKADVAHIKKVGKVNIVATQGGDATWAIATPATRSLTINAKALTIKANDTTKEVGKTDPKFTAKVTGILPADTAAVSAAIKYTRALGETVGTYDITASGVTAPNYAITYQKGTFTILPKANIIVGNELTGNYTPGLYVKNNPVALSSGRIDFVAVAGGVGVVHLIILDAYGNKIDEQNGETATDGIRNLTWDLTTKAGAQVTAGEYVAILVVKSKATGSSQKYTAMIGVR